MQRVWTMTLEEHKSVPPPIPFGSNDQQTLSSIEINLSAKHDEHATTTTANTI